MMMTSIGPSSSFAALVTVFPKNDKQQAHLNKAAKQLGLSECTQDVSGISVFQAELNDSKLSQLMAHLKTDPTLLKRTTLWDQTLPLEGGVPQNTNARCPLPALTGKQLQRMG
jgi:hypothetical protein